MGGSGPIQFVSKTGIIKVNTTKLDPQSFPFLEMIKHTYMGFKPNTCWNLWTIPTPSVIFSVLLLQYGLETRSRKTGMNGYSSVEVIMQSEMLLDRGGQNSTVRFCHGRQAVWTPQWGTAD